MANQSIYNAFERMWQHVLAALSKKADIPTPTEEDEGKVLKVVDGVATWVAIPNAEEESF